MEKFGELAAVTTKVTAVVCVVVLVPVIVTV
jgi:hypothetical protein